MERKKNIDLTTLIKPGLTDSISGRSFGEEFAKKIKLTELIKENYFVEFFIDASSVKAINDSFIKGLFSSLFENFDYEKIHKSIKINASDYYQSLFEKNLKILQALSNV